MGAAVLTGNILGAVLSIVSLFSDPGPRPEQVILEQVQALQREVASLGQIVEARFDQLDQMVRTFYRDVMDQFVTINERLNRLEVGLSDIRDQLARQDRSLNRIEGNLDLYIRDQLVREFWRNRFECIRSREYFPSTQLSEGKFRDCLIDFHRQATVGAVTTPEVANASATYADSLDLAATLTSDRLYSNTDFLARMAPSFGSSAPANPYFQRVPNILTWTMGAEAYMQTMLEWPEYVPLTSPAAIDEMIKMGENTQTSLTSLAFRKTQGGTQRARLPFFGALTNNYKQRVADVRVALQKLAKDYQDANTSRYSMYSNENQDVPPSHEFRVPEKLQSCSDSELKNQEIAAPVYLDLVVPSQIRMASNLASTGSHKVGFCYKAEWTERREIPYCVNTLTRWTFTEKRGKVKITIRGYVGESVFLEQTARSPEFILAEGRRERERVDDCAKWGFRDQPAHHFNENLSDTVKRSWDRFWRLYILGRHFARYTDEDRKVFSDYMNGEGKTSGSTLMAFINPPVENVTNKTVFDQVTVDATTVIFTEFDRHRDLFWRQRVVPNVGDGDLGRALSRLTGAKLLIQSYLELLLPSSVESDDRLRGLLYGSIAIMTGDDVAKGLVENSNYFLDRLIIDGSISPFALPPSDMEVRIDGLARALIDVLGDSKRGVGERNRLISHMLVKLLTFRAIHWPQPTS